MASYLVMTGKCHNTSAKLHLYLQTRIHSHWTLLRTRKSINLRPFSLVKKYYITREKNNEKVPNRSFAHFLKLYPFATLSGDKKETKKTKRRPMKNGGSFERRNMNILLNESRKVSGQFFTSQPRIIRWAKNARAIAWKTSHRRAPCIDRYK